MRHISACECFPQFIFQRTTGQVNSRKPETADLSGSTFAHCSELLKSMETQSESETFSCNVCGSAFLDSSSLKIHMQTHNGKKPFSCKIIGYNRTSNNTMMELLQ